MQLEPILISVAVVSGIATLLAVLMVLAEATIANYGEVTITVNGDKKLTVEGGRPLLATLKAEEVFIPSACGGRGSCGLCKVKVNEGGGDYLPTELPWLSKEEMEGGVRLSCQLKVKRDMGITVPEELFSVKQFDAEVISLKDLTYDIKEVRLKLLEPMEIEYKPGQFIQFEVPEYELTDEPVYRAYSMASDPAEKGIVELEIRYVPDGICTTYVHKHLKVGDRVTLNGPYGEFYLRPTERDAVFLAGGSGMAPIKSILLDAAAKNNGRKMTYFFGARSRRDLFLEDAMESIEKVLPNFRFVPALSEPAEDDDWQGETGLITDVLDRNLPSGDNVEAYLCGSPGMIGACMKVLTAKGVPEELIYYDKF